MAEEVCCNPTRRLAVKLNERELRRPINGNEEIEPALGSLHFGDIDMEEADRIDLELLFGDLLTPQSAVNNPLSRVLKSVGAG